MKSLIILAGTVAAITIALNPVAPAPAAAQQGAAPAAGEALFKQRCAACHAIGGKGGKVGPDLTGIVGKKAGSGTFAYSAAMKGSKTVWNARSLDAYLAAPTKAVPGTKMVIALTKPDDRTAVISYLSKAR